MFIPNSLRNKVTERIANDIIFLRKYYQKKELELYDQSNTYLKIIDLENSMRIIIDTLQTFEFNENPLTENKSVREVLLKILKY